VVFDLEAAFLYPWAALYRDMATAPGIGWLVLGEMLLFLGILGAGLAYVWKRGTLDWK
jgi:NADH-quinone oxidoreductase subunit A